MLSDFEQKVYNTYLATSRSALRKPFTLRKDFSKFTETDPNYRFIKKLGAFFTKHPQVDMKVYFMAPFEIYKDGETYDLKFFASQKAIGLYSMFMKKLQEQSPDTDDQISSIKASLGFIIKYCHANSIMLSGYTSYKEPGATMEAYLSHFKNNQVNIYVLLKMPNFERKMYELDEELRELFFGPVLDKIASFKIKLYNSTKAKLLIEDTLKKATQILQPS